MKAKLKIYFKKVIKLNLFCHTYNNLTDGRTVIDLEVFLSFIDPTLIVGSRYEILPCWMPPVENLFLVDPLGTSAGVEIELLSLVCSS